jgi:hypothetical protein
MSRGREANLTERLAACLLMLKRGNGEPLIPVDRETAKGMTAREIVSMVDFDHEILKRIGGTNHPTNLTPRLRSEHREKTAKVDQPVIAKARRYERLERTGSKKTKPGRAWPKGQKIPKHNDPWGKKWRAKQ